MPSPQGLYIPFTQAQRDALRAKVLDRMTNGARTSLSGGVKSGSKSYVDDNLTLFELNYADDRANGVARPQKVVQVLNHQYPLTQLTP